MYVCVVIEMYYLFSILQMHFLTTISFVPPAYYVVMVTANYREVCWSTCRNSQDRLVFKGLGFQTFGGNSIKCITGHVLNTCPVNNENQCMIEEAEFPKEIWLLR